MPGTGDREGTSLAGSSKAAQRTGHDGPPRNNGVQTLKGPASFLFQLPAIHRHLISNKSFQRAAVDRDNRAGCSNMCPRPHAVWCASQPVGECRKHRACCVLRAARRARCRANDGLVWLYYSPIRHRNGCRTATPLPFQFFLPMSNNRVTPSPVQHRNWQTASTRSSSLNTSAVCTCTRTSTTIISASTHPQPLLQRPVAAGKSATRTAVPPPRLPYEAAGSDVCASSMDGCLTTP